MISQERELKRQQAVMLKEQVSASKFSIIFKDHSRVSSHCCRIDGVCACVCIFISFVEILVSVFYIFLTYTISLRPFVSPFTNLLSN